MLRIPSLSSITSQSFFRMPSLSGRYTLLTAGLVLGGISLGVVWYLFRSRHPGSGASPSATLFRQLVDQKTEEEQDTILLKDGFPKPDLFSRDYYWNLKDAFGTRGSMHAYPSSLLEKKFILARKDFKMAMLISASGNVYRLKERDLKKEPVFFFSAEKNSMLSEVEKISPNPLPSSPENIIGSVSRYNQSIIWTEKGSNIVYFKHPDLQKTTSITCPESGQIQYLTNGRDRCYFVTHDKLFVYKATKEGLSLAFNQPLSDTQNPICALEEYGYGIDQKTFECLDYMLIARQNGTIQKYSITSENKKLTLESLTDRHHEIQQTKAFRINNDEFLLTKDEKGNIHIGSFSEITTTIPNAKNLDLASAQLDERCLFLRATDSLKSIHVYNSETGRKLGHLECSHEILHFYLSGSGICAMGPERYTFWQLKNAP